MFDSFGHVDFSSEGVLLAALPTVLWSLATALTVAQLRRRLFSVTCRTRNSKFVRGQGRSLYSPIADEAWRHAQLIPECNQEFQRVHMYSDALMGDAQAGLEQGTVAFGSGLPGWGFNVAWQQLLSTPSERRGRTYSNLWSTTSHSYVLSAFFFFFTGPSAQ